MLNCLNQFITYTHTSVYLMFMCRGEYLLVYEAVISVTQIETNVYGVFFANLAERHQCFLQLLFNH